MYYKYVKALILIFGLTFFFQYLGIEDSCEDKEYINNIPPKEILEPTDDFEARLEDFLNYLPRLIQERVDKSHNNRNEEKREQYRRAGRYPTIHCAYHTC